MSGLGLRPQLCWVTWTRAYDSQASWLIEPEMGTWPSRAVTTSCALLNNHPWLPIASQRNASIAFKALHQVGPALSAPVHPLNLMALLDLPCICQAASYCLKFLFLLCLTVRLLLTLQNPAPSHMKSSREAPGRAVFSAVYSHDPETLVNCVMATCLMPLASSGQGRALSQEPWPSLGFHTQ